MKQIALALTGAGALVLTASAAQAQSRQGFEIGVEGYRYDYEEEFEGARIVEDQGRLYGLTLEYGRAFRGAWDFRVKARAAGGRVDYRSDEGDRLDDVVQATVQTELLIGRSFPVGGGQGTVTPFAGLGARGHGDDSGGEVTDTGLQGYDRYVFYAYAPIGATAELRAGPRSTFTFTAQYNLFLGGDATSNLSDVDAEAPDLELELEDGHGWALSAEVNRAVGGGTVSFGPFVRYWSIDRSTSQVFQEDGFEIEFFEPENRTVEAGVRLAYRF